MTISDLEKIKTEIRKVSKLLLNLDMEDRWGSKDLMSLERREKDFEKMGKNLEKLESTLLKKVERLRIENPELLKEWAEAHIYLLKEFISRHKHNRAKFAVEISQAKYEMNDWKQFAKGTQYYLGLP
jgi:DNA integrity scanning protein DisA with diadenylate cyclase activity